MSKYKDAWWFIPLWTFVGSLAAAFFTSYISHSLTEKREVASHIRQIESEAKTEALSEFKDAALDLEQLSGDYANRLPLGDHAHSKTRDEILNNVTKQMKALNSLEPYIRNVDLFELYKDKLLDLNDVVKKETSIDDFDLFLAAVQDVFILRKHLIEQEKT